MIGVWIGLAAGLYLGVWAAEKVTFMRLARGYIRGLRDQARGR